MLWHLFVFLIFNFSLKKVVANPFDEYDHESISKNGVVQGFVVNGETTQQGDFP